MHRHMIEDGVDVEAAAVGHHQFHEVAPCHQPQARHDVGVIQRVALTELRQQVVGALDGAGDELWEERHEEGVGGEVALHARRAAIDVDGIAEGLKRIERDADGQQQAERRHVDGQSAGPEGRLDVGAQEVVIFKQEEDGEVEHQAGDEASLLRPPRREAADADGCDVGDDGAREQQQGIGGLPVHVEIIAGCEQQQVARPQLRRRQRVIEHADDGEEQQECYGIEQHFLFLFSPGGSLRSARRLLCLVCREQSYTIICISRPTTPKL